MPHLLEELQSVAHRERFRRWFSADAADRLVSALVLTAEMHPDPDPAPPVCADPDDDYLFALATAAGCPFLVTGDRQVQAVDHPNLAVLTPRTAIETWRL